MLINMTSIIIRGVMNNKARSVLLITGTSSAGKTLISKELATLLVEDVALLSVDDVLWNAVLEEANRMGIIHDGMSIELQQRLVMEHKREVFAVFLADDWQLPKQTFNKSAKSLTDQYGHVVVDTVFGYRGNFDDRTAFMQVMENVSMFSVLVYCSPLKLAQHVIERNGLSGHRQKRDLLFVMKQFPYLYQPAIAQEDSIAVVTQQEIDEALSMVLQHLQEDGVVGVDVQKSIDDIQKFYYETFGLESQSRVAITHRFKHDMVVNTGNLSLQQCAELIYAAYKDRG